MSDYQLHVFPFSTTERRVPSVPMPVGEPLEDDEFWDSSGLPNLINITNHLYNEGKLKVYVNSLLDCHYLLLVTFY